jgi:hypothetical protein
VRFSIESHGGAARLLAAASSPIARDAHGFVWMVFLLCVRNLLLYRHQTQLDHDGG